MADGSSLAGDARVFLLNVIEVAAAIFRGPDSEQWPVVAEAVAELAGRPPMDSGHSTPSLKNLQESLLILSEREDGLLELETEFVRLFVSSAGGVAAPPYQSCHVDGGRSAMGKPAQAMRERLNEIGLVVAMEGNEPPDHLAIELEYLYCLLAEGWFRNRRELAERGRDFARREMEPWVRRFGKRVMAASPHPVYARAVELTAAVLDDVSKS